MRPTRLLVRAAVSAVALLAAALLVPGIEVAWGEEPQGALVTLVALALVFGLVNAFVRPVVRLLALPLNLFTMGLSAFVVNAGLLLLVAGLLDLLWEPRLTIGGFPPRLDAEAFVVALVGSVVISVVSTAMALLIPDA